MEEERAKVRVVRCPKCDKLLPELTNFSVYRCGGCNATLQAKKQIPTSEASSEKSNAEFAKYLENAESCLENKQVIVSDASSEFDPKAEFGKEEKKSNLNESPNSDTSEYRDDVPKEPDTSRLDTLLMESKYRRSSKAPADAPAADADASAKAKSLENANEFRKFRPARRDEDRERASAFRRPSDEGPSSYPNTSKKRNLDIDQDRAELLRKLDELRDQLKKSCEVAEKSKERFRRGNWIPEGSSSLNRTASRHSPFANGHGADVPNLYGEVFARAPFHPYPQRPTNSCAYGQFDSDPLVSYHHDGFYHQPACSCLHCYNSHGFYPVYGNQRFHGFYPVDGPVAFGPQSYSRRDPTASRQRATFAKKDERSCRAVAGAAPFVSCYHCFELLQLPEDFSGTGRTTHRLRCGSCSRLISFDFDGRRLAAAPAANVTSENGCTNRRPTVNSSSGDFGSPGYEVCSAEEKLVNEATEKDYAFRLSSPSVSDDADTPDVPSSSLPLREHFGYPLSDQAVDGPGNGSRSRRSDPEKVLSVNGNYKQNSVKEIPVATESDLGLSQDLWEESNDENQPRAKNAKSGESFFAGLIKKSFKDLSRSNQATDGGKCKVSVNGHPISDRSVKKAEKLAGPVHPGDYWYDYRAGFWGVMGHACLGIIPPFIEEFNYPMPRNCAGGSTGVLVNGRELHLKDLALLASRGLPSSEGRSYIIEMSGKVWDEDSGEELDGLGKLAPTIEKVKHGFGMRVPRLMA